MWELTQQFASEGGIVRWDVFGDGPPVVLVHGTPFSSFVWRDIARGLATTHRVFVWDLLGYGASEQRPGQDMSLAAQTRVFAALLDHWELADPAVVAHDFGGAITLRTFLLEQRRFERLALMDVVALAPWGTGFFHLVQQHPEAFHQLPATHHEALVRAHIRTATMQRLPREIEDALLAPWLGEQGQAAHYRNIEQNDQRYTDEVQPRYGEINVPTLILWGEDDQWLPVRQARELHGLLPNSRLSTIADAGHLVQYDAPATVIAALMTFLDRRSAERGGPAPPDRKL
jgi:pimeloyl-ACP methyl ester carboxylesterase